MRPQLLALWGLAACGAPDLPTPPDAFLGVFELLDSNDDGRIDNAEYDAHAYAAPDFASADGDRDGGLDPLELARLMWSQDPTSFDRTVGEEPRSLRLPASAEQGRTAGQRHLRNLILYLVDELHRADPALRLPSRAGMRTPDDASSLQDPAIQRQLQGLAAEYRRLGLVFPPGLLEEPLSPAP